MKNASLAQLSDIAPFAAKEDQPLSITSRDADEWELLRP